MDEKQLAGCIEHSLLRPEATSEQIIQLCEEAKQYSFYAVCINPRWINIAADKLHGSTVKVCSVISFPLGADSTRTKITMVNDAMLNGANEIDMVADLAAIIEGDSKYLTGQLRSAFKICRSAKPPVVLKVIIEAAALNLNQKIFACQIAENCGLDFIKTSTGFHPAGGATVEDVKLIKEIAPSCKIKAAGGIKTAKQALEMLKAGAHRIGTSSGVQIINELRAGQQ